MALIDNVVSYWTLDEASGSRLDSHSSNTLTDNNTVTSATGKINNAGDFEASNSEYLSIADASQSGLDITGDMSLSFWLNFESYGGSTVYSPLSKINYFTTDAQRAWGVEINVVTANSLGIDIGNGTTAARRNVSWTPSTATWYHVVIVYTASAGSVSFYVNGSQQGTTQTGFPTSILNSAHPFQIGAVFDNAAIVNMMDGLIDEVGIWNRVLTGGEITSLYNAGAGLAYPFTTSPIKTINGLAKASIKSVNGLI